MKFRDIYRNPKRNALGNFTKNSKKAIAKNSPQDCIAILKSKPPMK
jgi:hypothetical protein